MFSASYCQKEKNMYEKVNRPTAMIITYDAIKFMLPLTPLEEPPEKACATLAIMSEIEGRIMPASMAETVPIPKSVFSNGPMYLKNVMKAILSGASSLSISI